MSFLFYAVNVVAILNSCNFHQSWQKIHFLLMRIFPTFEKLNPKIWNILLREEVSYFLFRLSYTELLLRKLANTYTMAAMSSSTEGDSCVVGLVIYFFRFLIFL